MYGGLHGAFFTFYCWPTVYLAETYKNIYTEFHTFAGITLSIGLIILYILFGKSKVATKLKKSFIENAIALVAFISMNAFLISITYFFMVLGNEDFSEDYLYGYSVIFKYFIAPPEFAFLLIYLVITLCIHLRSKKS